MLVEEPPTDQPKMEDNTLSTAPTSPLDEPSPSETSSLDLDRTPQANEEGHSLPLSLEDRVRRLEDVIASLHLAPQEWLEPVRPPKEKTPDANGIVSGPRATPVPKELPPPKPITKPALRGQPWLLVDIYAELRAMMRMFLDPRYSLTWQTRLLTPLMVIAIVLSRMLLSSIPIIGWLLDLVIYPIMLYFLFKVLSREATRYRMTSPDVPVGLRL